MVPGARFELARGYPYAPQTYVSTKFHHPGYAFAYWPPCVVVFAGGVGAVVFVDGAFVAGACSAGDAAGGVVAAGGAPCVAAGGVSP